MHYAVVVLFAQGPKVQIAHISGHPQDAFDAARGIQRGRLGHTFAEGDYLEVFRLEDGVVYTESLYANKSHPNNPVVYQVRRGKEDWGQPMVAAGFEKTLKTTNSKAAP